MRLFIRLTLTGVLVGLCLTGWAQKVKKDSTKTNQPSVVTNSASANPPSVSDLFSTYAPKSPTAAGLGRYGEYPVNLYTGLPTIEIPLFEFKVGTLTVPIKLTYHAAGNKVNDIASWVGLGWSLQTGGQINRTVLGRPDEQNQGLLNQPVPDPNSYYNSNCTKDADDSNITARADNIDDTQRDMFAYQTPNGTNSFLLTPTTETPAGFAFLRPEPVIVAYDATLSSFTVTDESGTRFRFSDGEATSGASGAYSYSGFTSTWYLSEIVSFNTSDRALYSYVNVQGQPTPPEPVDSQSVLSELSDPNGNSGITTGPQGIIHSDGATTIQARFLQELQFPGGKVRFVLEARPASLGGGYNLDSVKVYGYNVSSSQFTLIKQFDLVYSTATRANTSIAETFLSKVRLLQTDGTELGSYLMSYNATPLPAPNSVQKDYWGYYNYNSGQTLIPRQIPDPTFSMASGTQTIPIGDANRDPAEDRMKAWILQSIQYPTGGSTQFDFETNRYLNNGTSGTLAGGLRIRQIRSYSAANQLATVKTYKYGPGESGDGTFRTLIQFKPSVKLTIKNYDPAPGGNSFSYAITTFSSSPTYPLTPAEGSPVTYPSVSEYSEDGQGNNTGKIIYQYRDQASDQYTSIGAGKGYLVSRSWDRGQLVSKIVTAANGTLLSSTVNSYTSLGQGTSSGLAGVLVLRTLRQTNAKSVDANGCYVHNPSGYNSDDMYNIRTYNFSYGTTLLASSSESSYADDNSGNHTVQTTETDYYTNFYLPSETRLKAEGGIVLGTQLTYAQNFNTIPAGGAITTELKGIRAMQQRNAYLPIETVHYRKENSTAPADYKTGQLTTYSDYSLNGLTTALPYQTYFLEALYNSFNGAPYQSSAQRTNTASNGTFVYDPHFVPRLKLSGYDANGNPTGYTITNGSTTALGYNTYTPSGGVLFSVVSQLTRNAGQANAQQTSYGYSLPVLGPTSMTDPRGIVTSYLYDRFGRLSTVKDNGGNVLKQYSYHYATQP